VDGGKFAGLTATVADGAAAGGPTGDSAACGLASATGPAGGPTRGESLRGAGDATAGTSADATSVRTDAGIVADASGRAGARSSAGGGGTRVGRDEV
jgi:hypothetical protein